MSRVKKTIPLQFGQSILQLKDYVSDYMYISLIMVLI